MPMTSREMIKLLKKNGFKKVSQNGSHVKMKNEENGKIEACEPKLLERGENVYGKEEI